MDYDEDREDRGDFVGGGMVEGCGDRGIGGLAGERQDVGRGCFVAFILDYSCSSVQVSASSCFLGLPSTIARLFMPFNGSGCSFPSNFRCR